MLRLLFSLSTWEPTFGVLVQLPDLPLKDLPKGWILDLDGTLVVHNGYKTGKDTLLPGVKDFFEKNVKRDDYVLIISARFSVFKGIAEKCLKKNGIRYDKIIYDTPRGERILINDRKPWGGGIDTAYSFNIDRDSGL